MLHRIAVAALLVVSLTGCAAMMTPPKSIAVTSSPTGAAIYLNDVAQWTTPAVIDLGSSQPRTLRVELDGYRPYEVQIERKVSGWFWANILFNGGWGMVFDAITGEMYRLTPEQVVAQLRRSDVAVDPRSDAIHVLVTLEPDPAWGKVGHVER